MFEHKDEEIKKLLHLLCHKCLSAPKVENNEEMKTIINEEHSLLTPLLEKSTKQFQELCSNRGG